MRLSPEIKSFIKKHETDDIRDLALKAKHYPNMDMPFVLQQIAGRQIAKEKIPSWYNCDNIIYPKHISLEQCSSENTAHYKACLCQGKSLVDLTGGLGVDFAFISQKFEQATYIEKQQELSELAINNFAALQLSNIKVINADAINYLQSMEKVDLIYIDPARRDITGRKTVLIEDCSPDIVQIEKILEKKAERIMIKLSPMLDISLALNTLSHISDVYAISNNNECKELLFIKKNCETNTQIHCVNIRKERIDEYSFSKEEEEQAVIDYTSHPGKYLYEPNSSIIKAGAYKSIANKFNLNKLHINSHLYTSEILHPDFQGRKFRIESISTLNKKELKQHTASLTKANITVRNFPLSVEDIRKKIRLNDGGDTYIFATTLADERKVIIFCHKV